MRDPRPQAPPRHLLLADGTRWVIAAGDEGAVAIVAHLADAMQLSAASPAAMSVPARRLLVLVDAHNPHAALAAYSPPQSGSDDWARCVLRAIPDDGGLSIQLAVLGLLLVWDAQTRGGVLLHGALAERAGAGVILAARGGTGKSTASRRLHAPWRSLSDDATLVVPDARGNYWAHPWPTWSRFRDGGAGGAWDVQQSVPLTAVFFLKQAADDGVGPVGRGQAVSLLVQSAEQTSQAMARGLSAADTCALRLERFNNLCALARATPTFVLRISLTGTFWQEIEETLRMTPSRVRLHRSRILTQKERPKCQRMRKPSDAGTKRQLLLPSTN